MKTILIITLFLTTQLLANYAFKNEKNIKIDMHGGKSTSLLNNNSFKGMKAKGLKEMSSFGIQKPKSPIKPDKKEIPKLEDIKLK